MKMKFMIEIDLLDGKFSCDPKIISSEEEKTKKINLVNVAEQITGVFEYLAKNYGKAFLKTNKINTNDDDEGKLD